MSGDIIPKKIKNDFAAITAPTVNYDKSEGWTAGSIVYIPTTGATYLCVSNAEGAAVWRLLSGEQYIGVWNASTNSPALADGTGTASTYYIVSVAGTQNLGSGAQTFTAGDKVIYNGTIWQKQEGGTSYVPEDVANKATDFSTVNDTLYPTVEAVNEQLALKVNKAGDVMTGTLQFLQQVNAQTGTTYTLEATDYAKLITVNSASAVTFTLPQQSTLTTTDGFWCKVRNLGAGAITFVKEGAETLDGNALLNQYGEALIERPSTTKWSVAYSTVVMIEQETVCILGTLTNDKVYDVFSAPDDNITILGFSLRNTSAGTAGTYTAKINGTNITGLTAIPNTTTRTRTDPTALNTMTYQQVLQYVPTGTTSVVDAFITVFYTRNY